jgi:hypothetical protein
MLTNVDAILTLYAGYFVNVTTKSTIELQHYLLMHHNSLPKGEQFVSLEIVHKTYVIIWNVRHTHGEINPTN